MASIKFNDVYLNDYYTIVGPVEKNGKLKGYDSKMNDYYYEESTFEQAQIKMQKMCIKGLINKCNMLDSNIDLLVGGDLLNQLGSTNYSSKYFDIPLLGVYSACSTFTESLIISSMFLNSFNNIITVTSSHNKCSERQFRYPIEYGIPKLKTSSFSTTASVASLVSHNRSNIKIESCTIGKVIDMGITNVNNMGSIMAPASSNTIYEHLKDLKRSISYYDLILTGDLGCNGLDILKKYTTLTYGIELKNVIDCGCNLYSDIQEVYSGGSGPVCLPLVLFNKILLNKKYKKILLVGTGSMHNPTMVNQHITIPAISHVVSLEVIK